MNDPVAQDEILGGTVHELPGDFRRAIASDTNVEAVWADITPLARNEWICWVISGAKAETRDHRISAGLDKMRQGMRRPCCWSGCVHRPEKPMSASQK
ncbi:MAG: YdeI/OmpD-associated family protein [Sphingosinicella sp.]